MAKAEVVFGREPVSEVRIEASAVHWEGARIVTHISTNPANVGIIGQHFMVADEMCLHPAGVWVRVGEKEYIVPHSRVELYRLQK
jgi:hypothetical protein